MSGKDGSKRNSTYKSGGSIIICIHIYIYVSNRIISIILYICAMHITIYIYICMCVCAQAHSPCNSLFVRTAARRWDR